MSEKFSQLVVIGSSAGGIEALSTVLGSLKADFKAPIVIAQHIDPKRPSHLAEILGRRCALPVRTITQREDLEPGVVFVVPANRDVEVTDHSVALHQDARVLPKPSVDLLLSSAAKAFGEGLIAVILSGSGSDGAAGARHVKQHGGTVIIEDPDTAQYPGMPQSLSPTTVDIVANLDRVGAVLEDLLAGTYVPAPAGEPALENFLDELRERSGIDFSSYKRPTIQRRLRRRMAATDQSTQADYFSYVDANPEEYQRLINSFLIKVTEFFRDAELYDYLRSDILPGIVDRARRRGNEIRMWSAGCATGEEAYSLAIATCEVLGKELDNFQVRIFATDVDNDAVNFARRGLYPAAAVSGVPPELLDRYFIEDGGEYEIKKRVRALTVFGQHDLGQRAPFPHTELILCRNVLIYFTSELQKRALQLFAFSLRDNGYLALGKAESASPLAEHFVIENPVLNVYRRQGERMLIPPARIKESRPATPLRLMLGRHQPSGRDLVQRTGAPGGLVSLSERLEDALLRLPLGVALIDASYDIRSINSSARQLLGIHGAAIGDDFVHLSQNVPSRPLRAAIDHAVHERAPATLDEIEVTDSGSGQSRYLDFILQLQPDGNQGGIVVVLVLDVTERVRQRLELQTAAEIDRRELSRLGEQLGRMTDTNGELLQANQELTTVNMELRSANEEFLVDNEEVQAATEEVETLNEELQATNEELETLNEELQATVEELNTTNDDLQARSVELQDLAMTREEQRRQIEEEKARLEIILESMASAVLVVDRQEETVLANDAYEQMFGASSGQPALFDLDGRPLAAHEMPRRRAANGEAFRSEFMGGPEGSRRWYEAVATPLRDNSDSPNVGGGVIVISDITDRSVRRMQDQFLAIASHELRTPLTSLHGFLELAQRELKKVGLDGKMERQLDMALHQARRLNVLVNDLVDAARLQSGKLTLLQERLDLNQLTQDAVQSAQNLAPDRPLSVQLSPEPLPVIGDPGRLEQVLLNLLSNAFTYTGHEDHIEVRLARSDGQAHIAVADSGPGIPAAELPNLFARFYQVSSGSAHAQQGLGLGLYIAHEFVTAHGGTIEVTSELGRGTTFTVHLSLAK